jgi:hypothetical protein
LHLPRNGGSARRTSAEHSRPVILEFTPYASVSPPAGFYSLALCEDMSGSLPWAQAASGPASNDPNELLRRIEGNTASLVQWMKYLVAAVVALVLINLLFLI